MKLSVRADKTSLIVLLFIPDTTKADGSGLTGLAYNSAGLSAYYVRSNETAAVAITLATMTLGTFASGGFKEVDATNLPGVYQFCIPNAALASGASSVVVMLKGATNMPPIRFEIAISPEMTLTPEGLDNVTNTAPAAGNLASLNFRGRLWSMSQTVLSGWADDGAGAVTVKDNAGTSTIISWEYTKSGLSKTVGQPTFS